MFQYSLKNTNTNLPLNYNFIRQVLLLTSFQGISTFITSTATVVSPTAPSSACVLFKSESITKIPDCCCRLICLLMPGLPPGLTPTHPEGSWTQRRCASLTFIHRRWSSHGHSGFLRSLFHVQVSGPVLIWRAPGSVFTAGKDAAVAFLHGLPRLQLWGFRCSPDTRSNVPPHDGMLKRPRMM